jgi:hypothetical protein
MISCTRTARSKFSGRNILLREAVTTVDPGPLGRKREPRCMACWAKSNHTNDFWHHTFIPNFKYESFHLYVAQHQHL